MIKLVTRKLFELAHGYPHPLPGSINFWGKLGLRHIRADGTFCDRGIVGERVVTTVFCEDLVDNLITEVAKFGDYKYHQSGVGTGSPVIGDTYATIDLTGPPPGPVAGTQVESTSVIYQSVATVPYTSTLAITEHGIGNQATWAAGCVMMDRHTFTVVNVVNGDSIVFTYSLTCTAGG